MSVLFHYQHVSFELRFVNFSINEYNIYCFRARASSGHEFDLPCEGGDNKPVVGNIHAEALFTAGYATAISEEQRSVYRHSPFTIYISGGGGKKQKGRRPTARSSYNCNR